jgi:hypothetical protein
MDTGVPEGCVAADFGGKMIGCVMNADITAKPDDAERMRAESGYQGVAVYAPDGSGQILGYYMDGMTGYVQNALLPYTEELTACYDVVRSSLDAMRSGERSDEQPRATSERCHTLFSAQGQSEEFLAKF